MGAGDVGQIVVMNQIVAAQWRQFGVAVSQKQFTPVEMKFEFQSISQIPTWHTGSDETIVIKERKERHS